MARPKRYRAREDRIRNEAIVDTYGPEEQALGWYYYLEGKLRLPFQAQCIASKVVSPLRKGETVEVRAHGTRRCVHQRHARADPLAGRNVAVPLSQLIPIDADESTFEAIGDWHYWVAQGYRF